MKIRRSMIWSMIFVVLFPTIANAGRYYDARMARWTALDPALNEGSPQEQLKKYGERLFAISPYAYGFNNPILNTDPDGRFPFPIIVAGIYFATQFSGDHPGGSPGLVQSTLSFGCDFYLSNQRHCGLYDIRWPQRR